MRKYILFLLTNIAFYFAPIHATTRLVPGTYATIQLALNAASSGDVIDIAAGTYTEKNLTISNKSVIIQGAGLGLTIVQAYATPNYTPANSCGVFNFDGTYTANETVTLQNMTIQNGHNAYSGGGIRLNNAGIQSDAPTFNFTNLKVTNNEGLIGGGMYLSGPIVINITGCNITSNSTTTGAGDGGGVYFDPNAANAVHGKLKNSTISFNTAIGNGGGIFVLCGSNGSTSVTHSLVLENCTVYGNSCTTSGKVGGGIDFRSAPGGQGVTPIQSLELNHCTVVNNTTNAGIGGDGVCIDYQTYNTTLLMNNSIIIGNSGSTSHQSQIGSNNSSQGHIINGGVSNSIFGIYGAGTNLTLTTALHNNLTANLSDLAFPSPLDATALSNDPTPVLKIGTASIAKDYVTTDYLNPIVANDQVANPRANAADAGAYEYGRLQAINFNSIAAKTYGDAPFALSATGGGSGNSVIFSSSNTNVATVAGSTVTVVGAGTCTIYANQAGTDPYISAPQVSQTLVVNPKSLTISTPAATNKQYDGTNTAVITGSLSGEVISDVVNLVGTSTFASVNVGTGISITPNCTLSGANAGNYTLVQPVGLTANISQSPQTITFAALASKMISDAPYTLNGTSSSGLSVSYSSSNTAVATISGTTLTITGPGTTDITASQAGNSNYSAASDLVRALTVTPTYLLTSSANISTLNGLNSSVDLVISGTGVKLTIDQDKTLNSVTVKPNAILNLANNTLAVSDLILEAGKSTAPSVSVTHGMTVTGAVKLLKTLDNSVWYFVSFPSDVAVNSITKVSGTGVLTAIGAPSPNWWIKYYDGATRATNGGATTNWKNLTTGDVLTANKGYIIGLADALTGDYVLSFPFVDASTVQSAETTKTVTVGLYGEGTASATNVGWNLVGIPYLSKFDANGVGANYLTVFNGSTYDQYPKAGLGRFLNPFESFFIQASTAGTSAALSFATNFRQLAPRSVVEDLSDQVQINLLSSTGTDHTNLIIDNTHTSAYEINQDLGKWITTGTDKPQIYTTLTGVNYAYNALSIQDVQDLPLAVYSKTGGKVFINANQLRVKNIRSLYLYDNVTGVMTDLLSNDYSYFAAAGTENTRLKISTQSISTKNSLVSKMGDPITSIVGRKLLVTNLNGLNTTVQVINLIGNTIINKSTSNNSINIDDLAMGVYIIQITDEINNWSKKIVIW